MIDTYFDRISHALERIDREDILSVCTAIKTTTASGNNIFVFGNGGSASTASHFAQDMNKILDCRFICLNDNVPSILAYGNDVGFDYIFKLQLGKLIKQGDLVIVISCSGNSDNIIDAMIYAKHFGYRTISLTGFDGGEVKLLTELNIHVPSNDMQVCEDCHLIITHLIQKLLK